MSKLNESETDILKNSCQELTFIAALKKPTKQNLENQQ